MFGRQFNSYKRLGDGTTGEVRLVRFPSGFKAVKRFYDRSERQEELRSIVKLQKKGLCARLFAISTAEPRGKLFLVLDYQGPSLRKWLKHLNPPVWPGDAKRLKFTLTDAIALARDLFDACRHLENARMIHGDIRPANICSLDRSRWVLIDFGLADDLKSGNPPYLRTFVGPSGVRAPENQFGYESVITPATEVYTAAMTAWQGLNGLAFTPESLNLLKGAGRLSVSPVGLARLPCLPSMGSGESTPDYEDRVGEYAAEYHSQFYEPFFRPFLRASLLYENHPLAQGLVACLVEEPEERPTAEAMLGLVLQLGGEGAPSSSAAPAEGSPFCISTDESDAQEEDPDPEEEDPEEEDPDPEEEEDLKEEDSDYSPKDPDFQEDQG